VKIWLAKHPRVESDRYLRGTGLPTRLSFAECQTVARKEEEVPAMLNALRRVVLPSNNDGTGLRCLMREKIISGPRSLAHHARGSGTL